MNIKTLSIIITIVLLKSQVNGDVFPFNTTLGFILGLTYGLEPTENFNATRYYTTKGLIHHHGYPFEEHEITTSDGYILNVHRIPHGKGSNESLKQDPVILIPGLLGDSLIYVFNGEINSPGFIMSNAGYDVWLHNNRGTRYARKHKTLVPDKDKQFWNYSFHEMGLYDLPATVDHVLSVTKSKQVFLIGHSMGGNIISIFLTENPSYTSKVNKAFLLAPAIKLQRTEIILGHNEYGLADLLLTFLMDTEVMPASDYLTLLVSHYCNDKAGIIICAWVLRSEIGLDVSHRKDLPIYFEIFSKTLAGTSVKTLRHFLQLIKRHDFSQYDYGTKLNLKAYGQKNPPNYQLGDIKTPISVFYSDADFIVKDIDVIEISQTFGNLISIKKIPSEGFSHLDYELADDVKLVLFDTILAQMETVEEQPNVSTRVHDSIYIVSFLVLLLMIFMFFILFLKDKLKEKYSL